ncbi:MAG: VOC family protein [Nannocystaceae bacterium]|nr:VOC family protein [Nannocystaceae bacterium]
MDPKAKKKKKKHKKGAPPAWKAIAGTPATAPVPPPYHTVTVALTTDDAAKAIEFYKTALGATERDRMVDPSGKIMHAELAIGDSFLMLSDEYPAMGSKAAKTLGGSPVALMFYTEDVDAAYAKATGAGATAALPVADMFWGDRYGAVLDAAGYLWGIATHKEDLTPEQIAERAKAAMPAAPAAAAEPAPAGDAAATPAAATPPAG